MKECSKKIVVCPDSFKGSLNAREVTKVISESLREKLKQVEIIELPLADGGEGTADILSSKFFPIKKRVKVHDPLGRLIDTYYHKDQSGQKIFIESALIIGLNLLKENERNPIYTTSQGLGEIIKMAINEGGKEINISLGGSATCDGGIGMLMELGIWMSDKTEENLFQDVQFNVICDVTNPLLGKNGAVQIYAPQKGAKSEDIPFLEKRLKEVENRAILKGYAVKEDSLKPGSGAAGGLGYAFQTFLNGSAINGINYILDKTNFKKVIKGANLIITGEGKIDKQSFMGKVLNGVTKIAQKEGIPVLAIGGIVEKFHFDYYKMNEKLQLSFLEIMDKKLDLKENMQKERSKHNIKKAIEKFDFKQFGFQ